MKQEIEIEFDASGCGDEVETLTVSYDVHPGQISGRDRWGQQESEEFGPEVEFLSATRADGSKFEPTKAQRDEIIREIWKELDRE